MTILKNNEYLSDFFINLLSNRYDLNHIVNCMSIINTVFLERLTIYIPQSSFIHSKYQNYSYEDKTFKSIISEFEIDHSLLYDTSPENLSEDILEHTLVSAVLDRCKTLDLFLSSMLGKVSSIDMHSAGGEYSL